MNSWCFMGESVVKLKEKDFHDEAFAHVKKILGEKCICCVLITCSEASKDGEMEVEMRFEGDESLAALLVENANRVFDDGASQRESK